MSGGIKPRGRPSAGRVGVLEEQLWMPRAQFPKAGRR